MVYLIPFNLIETPRSLAEDNIFFPGYFDSHTVTLSYLLCEYRSSLSGYRIDGSVSAEIY